MVLYFALFGYREHAANQSRKCSASRSNYRYDYRRVKISEAGILELNIKVNISRARVTINAYVHAWNERKFVEDAIWASPGVTEIVDNLRVA